MHCAIQCISMRGKVQAAAERFQLDSHTWCGAPPAGRLIRVGSLTLKCPCMHTYMHAFVHEAHHCGGLNGSCVVAAPKRAADANCSKRLNSASLTKRGAPSPLLGPALRASSSGLSSIHT